MFLSGQLLPEMARPVALEQSRAWVERLAATECPAFTSRRQRREEQSGVSQEPIVWREAFGSNVEDVDGNIYVDLTGGFGVATIGHRHPAVVAALRQQSKTLLHALGDLHPSNTKIALLEKLAELAPWDNARVALSLSGADAITTALKTAVLASGKPGVLAFEGSYHGLNYAALACTGYAPKFREPFLEQLNPHVRFNPWPAFTLSIDEALATLPDDWSQIGAVLIEPIQARGGVRIPPAGFLQALGERCHTEGTLLIVDEIFTGLGRCGSWWLGEAQGAQADLLCTGKSLGGGLPISACIGSANAMAAWADTGSEAIHTGTFFGNPLAAAAALAQLQVLEKEDLLSAANAGDDLVQALRDSDLPHVVDVRGKGMLIGIELDESERTLRTIQQLMARGYLTLPAGSDATTIQLAPALNIERKLLDGFSSTLRALLESGH